MPDAPDGPQVVCLASFNADLAVRVAQPIPRGHTVFGRDFSISPGGKGSNAAIACARQGARTAVLARVGRDPFGDLALRTWGAEGIDTRHVAVVEGETTGVGLIQVFDDGDNAIAVANGANDRIEVAQVERAADHIRAARVVMASCEVPLAVVQAAFAVARAAGVTTLLNPAPAVPLPDALLALCDVLTPNRGELLALAGEAVSSHGSSDPNDSNEAGDPPGLPDRSALQAAARLLQSRGAGTVVVTLGPDGCAAWPRSGAAARVPGHRVAVVDTVGAGDCFTGALAAALARGDEWAAALHVANAAAALSVTGAGALGAQPSIAQVRGWLASPASAGRDPNRTGRISSG